MIRTLICSKEMENRVCIEITALKGGKEGYWRVGEGGGRLLCLGSKPFFLVNKQLSKVLEKKHKKKLLILFIVVTRSVYIRKKMLPVYQSFIS